jgi:mono/diheme cytochrome c family protein
VARFTTSLLAVVGAMAIAGAVAFAWAGISARSEPGALEAWTARRARDLLIPARARRLTSPLSATPENLAAAKEHFADHCAICHGDRGRGDTPIGRGLHPRAPDLTSAATQALSDGQLFWIIENGVKLTGMPAFGDASEEDDAHAWQQVLWVRRLPQMPPEELPDAAHDHGSSHTGHGRASHRHERR